MRGADPTAPPLREALDGDGPVVVHVGDSPDSDAGGISRVIRNHLAREFGDIAVSCLASYEPRATTWLARQAPAVTSVVRLLRLGSVRTKRAVLHVHMSNRFSFVREGAFALLGRLLGWKVFVTWHASDGLRTRSGVSRRALRLALAPAHAVHVLSDSHATAAPVDSGRLVVLPNDVQMPSAPAPMEARRAAVVFAGEFGHRKGGDILLSAWRDLDRDVRADWTLEVFGRVAPAIGTVLTELDDDSVRVHGLVQADVVNRALLSSSIAVLPSRAEALPMFLLEAMAAGCAVVCTNVGAVPSVVGDAAGLVVRAGDPRALSLALTSLITSPELRGRLALAARDRVRDHYAERGMTRRWKEIYSGLLQ